MTRGCATLGDLVACCGGEVRTGPFGSQLHQHDYVDELDATPVVMPKDMIEGRVDTSSIARIDDDTVERLKHHVLTPGDIVLARRGDIGRRAWVGDREAGWLCGTGSMRISLRDCPRVRARYLHYYLATERAVGWLEGHAVGATMSNLSAGVVKQLPVEFPSIDVQDRIIGVLDAIEALIDNDRCRIETLEKIARLIYREWFVLFRFPNHQPVDLSGSEVGPIPRGWEVALTSDLIASGLLEIGDGYRAKNSEFEDEGYAFVRVKNVRDGYLDLADINRLPWSYGDKVGAKRAVPGDCVISMKGTVGRIAFVTERTPPIIYSPQVSYWRILDHNRISPTLLRLWMQSPAFVDQCARVKGSTDMADYVNLRDQRSMRVAIPPSELHQSFVAKVAPMLELSDNLRVQIEVLQAARDLLLPRLVSGEFDISDLDIDWQQVP